MMVVVMVMAVMRMMLWPLALGGKRTGSGGGKQRGQNGDHDTFHGMSPENQKGLLLFL